MTWKEIFKDKKRNHSVRTDQIVKEAKDRLEELKLEDYEELYRLQLTGTQRIWGILQGYIFKVLWWDPNHSVCPSSKRNT